jgi:hypothetical protein
LPPTCVTIWVTLPAGCEPEEDSTLALEPGSVALDSGAAEEEDFTSSAEEPGFSDADDATFEPEDSTSSALEEISVAEELSPETGDSGPVPDEVSSPHASSANESAIASDAEERDASRAFFFMIASFN